MNVKVIGLTGLTLVAACASNVALAEGEYDDRAYAGVMGGITETDSKRPQNYSDSLSLKFLYGGAKSEKLNTELSLTYSALEYDTATAKKAHDYQYILGYDVLYFLNREGWSPFGLIGGGFALEKRQPGDDEHLLLNAGVGVSKEINDYGAAIRGEARYVYNFDDAGGNDNPADVRILAGLTVPLSAKPAPAPEPAPAPAPAAVDSDGDGVIDSADKCPGTLAGVKVDGTGCAVPQVLRLNGVNFEFDKWDLDSNARRILDEASESIKSQPTMKVEIAGHTDSYGDDAYNQKLSQKRVESVRAYLVEKGAPADNFTAKGYGESEPIASNDNAAGREQNRRVEFRIIAQ